jgi:UDP-N-acetylglucosamine:LPS N-acetylglucosamine transferase
MPLERIATLGPLLYPAFHQAPPAPRQLPGRPLVVLGTGGNGANNHLALLENLLPLAHLIDVQVLCGRRPEVRHTVNAWAACHPSMTIEALGFQGPEAMVALYRRAWAMVARPGARTATEALMLGCPLIFNVIGSTMPQEQLARRYCRARQLERVIRRPQDLTQVVGAWLADQQAYQAFRDRWQQNRLASDPDAVLDMLLQS